MKVTVSTDARKDLYNILKNLVLDLTQIEYNRLCLTFPKYNQEKLIKKAVKKTNSLRKIQTLATKYKSRLPHEIHHPTIIPFYFKKIETVPPVIIYMQATKYLRHYSLLETAISNYSKTEIKSAFNNITEDELTKRLT